MDDAEREIRRYRYKLWRWSGRANQAIPDALAQEDYALALDNQIVERTLDTAIEMLDELLGPPDRDLEREFFYEMAPHQRPLGGDDG